MSSFDPTNQKYDAVKNCLDLLSARMPQLNFGASEARDVVRKEVSELKLDIPNDKIEEYLSTLEFKGVNFDSPNLRSIIAKELVK